MTANRLSDPAFISLTLCDNDYGHQLDVAAEQVLYYQGGFAVTCTPEQLQRAVVTIMVGVNDLFHATAGAVDSQARSREYLEERLRVEFLRHAPTVDHDGGSVAIDLNRRVYWRY